MNEFDPWKEAPEEDPRNAGRCEDCGHFEDDCRCPVESVKVWFDALGRERVERTIELKKEYEIELSDK